LHTINIPNGFFQNFCVILLYLKKNEKRQLSKEVNRRCAASIGYFVVVRTKNPTGNLWQKWQQQHNEYCLKQSISEKIVQCCIAGRKKFCD